MAINKAHSRPYCVDLAPSAYGAAQPEKKFSTVAANSLLSRSGRNPAPHAGAVRRSVQNDGKSVAYFATLAATAVAIVSAVAWTSNLSTTHEPAAMDLTSQAPTQIADVAPSFFFDDATDALERTTRPDDTEPVAAASPVAMTEADQQLPELTASFGARPTQAILEDRQRTESPEAPALTSPLPAAFTEPPVEQDSTPDLSDLDRTSQTIAALPAPQPAETNSTTVTVARGDTLSGILHAHGVSNNQLQALLTNELVNQYLVDISIGQVIDLSYDEDGSFSGLASRVAVDRRVNIRRTSDGFSVEARELPLEKRRSVASGTIDQSLYLSAERANLKQSTIMTLANIFQWELDFAREIQEGDKFSLVYDRLYREGEYIDDGDILAAEFIRGGKAYKAIRFTDDDGNVSYYSPDGHSMRRTFMRHPVDVVRITSKFNPNRLHPVLHKIQAHRGVDYGAPHGSPIYATADGKVTYSGVNGAYGNTVILQHGDRFTTLYAHMSRISDKSVTGTRVKQGDVIGYVGKTGRVTGTHLHYEFRVDGEQIDPLKIELPAAAPLADIYMPRLREQTEEMSALMDSGFEDLDKQMAAIDGPESVPR